YSDSGAKQRENALDVLKRHGVNILWRDNNSSSKGVADRVEFQDFRTPDHNPVCDIECRDEGMLFGLEDYIDSHPVGDVLIILHPMGSHGPEYYKRYPAAKEFFRPTCKTNELANCSHEELVNTYDNTIRYTDDFLKKVIDFIDSKYPEQETAMFYIGDHGESLGENGLYLHGMPFMVAPSAQTHVPAMVWTGKNFDFPIESIAKNKLNSYSHDNIYCTLLSVFEVQTSDCKPEDNMFFSE
ncbi:MAG: sulfatase-like hydrolase/transferase, partial [Bdellovibrionales bacterium]|nr:sulfatase-like hydrolase/transferase [Bdellovibrionales bacterium]